jgi:hypothetical protein
LFCRASGRDRFRLLFPGLRILTREWVSLFAYPLTGGFRPWSLIPASAVAPMLRLERAISPVLGWLLAFRLFVVLERVDG